MITFSIKFDYYGESYKADVFETDSEPKHWNLTVIDERLPLDFQKSIRVISDTENKMLRFGFLPNDKDNTFIKALTNSLEKYLI